MAFAQRWTFLLLAVLGCGRAQRSVDPEESLPMPCLEKQLTQAAHGHILTNAAVWSPDSRWIVYDVRSDPAGSIFDGTRIERVNVETGEVQVLYEARHGACVGVATCNPVDDRIVFIHGPEHPTADWSYAACRRHGVVVRAARPGVGETLDARDLTPPFTPGALRGGSHVHVFSGDGQWVSFTYEDHVLEQLGPAGAHEGNQRNIGVSVPFGPVRVGRGHPRNHDGSHFSVLVTVTKARPRPGSDEIGRAFEEAWVGNAGYVRADGQRQRRALAFQGEVVRGDGRKVSEVFLVDLPDDVTKAGDGPLEGTPTHRPAPPRGTAQRRLTYTTERKYPGIQGPRHWLRSSPDGKHIAFLMRDEAGVVQLWLIAPTGGLPRQLTRNAQDIASAFTWSPDGRWIAHILDGSVQITDVETGVPRRLTPRREGAEAPRPEACVFSPDGKKIAWVRPIGGHNQVWVVFLER